MSVRRRFAAALHRKGSHLRLSSRVFGEKVTQVSDFSLLKLVHLYFEIKGYDTEGLFRLSGSLSAINELAQKIDNGETVDILSIDDPHIVAGLLRKYLMQMPEPLLTYELCDCFLAASSVAQRQGKYEPLRKALALLQPPALKILRYVIRILYKASLRSEYNKMTASNLAIALSPSMLRSEANISDLTDVVKEATRSNILLEILITHCDELFPALSENYFIEFDESVLAQPPKKSFSSRDEATKAFVEALKNSLKKGHFSDWISPQRNSYYTPMFDLISKATSLLASATKSKRGSSEITPPTISLSSYRSSSVLPMSTSPPESNTSSSIPHSPSLSPSSSSSSLISGRPIRMKPYSFFVTPRGKLGIAFEGWSNSIVEFKDKLSQYFYSLQSSSVVESDNYKWPKLILGRIKMKSGVMEKLDLQIISNLCLEITRKLLFSGEPYEPLNIDVLHVSIFNDATPSLNGQLASLSIPLKHNSYDSISKASDPVSPMSRLFSDMGIQRSESGSPINKPKNPRCRVAITQFIEYSSNNEAYFALAKLFRKEFEKVKERLIDSTAVMSWYTNEQLSVILHMFKPKPVEPSVDGFHNSPLSGLITAERAKQMGILKLDAAEQQALISWMFGIVDYHDIRAELYSEARFNSSTESESDKDECPNSPKEEKEKDGEKGKKEKDKSKDKIRKSLN